MWEKKSDPDLKNFTITVFALTALVDIVFLYYNLDDWALAESSRLFGMLAFTLLFFTPIVFYVVKLIVFAIFFSKKR